jgi:hypothetical protein
MKGIIRKLDLAYDEKIQGEIVKMLVSLPSLSRASPSLQNTSGGRTKK